MDSQKASTYRPDIDGLRALAVTLVVLFHVETNGFDGGFVGVDVFFVISGYLITRILISNIDEGRFSFAEFYIRRLRRLGPALLVTIVLTIIGGAIVMSPLHFRDMGWSAVAAIVSVSNIWFWQAAGYFESAAPLKPLLHTWSLSVEEQFYLIWPAMIVILARMGWRKRIPLVLAGLALASLAANLMFWHASDAIFYLLPFRVFELAIGGLLVFFALPSMHQWKLEMLAISGIAAIVISTFAFDDKTIFPHLAALIPCLGTALIIMTGGKTATARLLGSKVPVWLGLRSYALYLVHWPIYTLFSFALGETPNDPGQIAVIIMSVFAAMALHSFVERPFRHGSSGNRRETHNKPFLKGMTAALVVTLALGGSIGHHNGWPWRLSAVDQARFSTIRTYATLSSNCQIMVNQTNPKLPMRKIEKCRQLYGPALVVIGDSHSEDLFYGLGSQGSSPFIIGLPNHACRIAIPEFKARRCKPVQSSIDELLTLGQDVVGLVVFTQSGRLGEGREANGDAPESMAQILRTLVPKDINLLWLGPRPEVAGSPDYAIPTPLHGFRGLSWHGGWKAYDLKSRTAAEKFNIAFVSLVNLTFPDGPSFEVDGHFLYRDTDHWAAFGQTWFAKKIYEATPALQEIAAAQNAKFKTH